MNAARHTDHEETGLVGARAILVLPGPGSPLGGALARRPGPNGDPAVSANPRPTVGLPAARATVLNPDVAAGLLDRWSHLRAAFDDDPRGSVHNADALLQDVSAAFTEALEEHRARLAAQWQVGRPGFDRLQDALQQYHRLVVDVLLRKS